MLAYWIHVGSDEPCPLCKFMDGAIVDVDDLGFLHPPLHPFCHCYLRPVVPTGDEMPAPTVFDWDEVEPGTRRAWVVFLAWLLRMGVAIPPLLLPLREDAEEYNRDRAQGAVDRQLEEALHLEGDDMPQNENGAEVRLQTNLVLGDAGDDFPQRIPMRLVRAGRTGPIRGFRDGVVFTPESLQDGVARGMFDGAAVFFRHVMEGRDVRDLAGVIASASWNDETESVDGVVFTYDTMAGRELQALASGFRDQKNEGVPQPDVGISIDSFFAFDRSGEVPRSRRLLELLSVDVVFRPAADGRILASAAHNPEGGNQMEREQVLEVLSESGLPEEVVERLAAETYADEAALQEMIDQAREAERGTAEAVTTNGGASAAGRGSAMRNGDAGQQGMFGVSNPWALALRQDVVNARLAAAELPEPVTRRLAA